jgi:hypothetical protein
MRKAMSPVPRDIEYRKRRLPRRIDRRHERVLPGSVQPERHQVVHQIVAARDAVKNVVN